MAALNHPNICQLYDVGPNYLVLEYVEGSPVAPTESIRKLLDIAVQIADGMAAAHAAGRPRLLGPAEPAAGNGRRLEQSGQARLSILRSMEDRDVVPPVRRSRE